MAYNMIMIVTVPSVVLLICIIVMNIHKGKKLYYDYKKFNKEDFKYNNDKDIYLKTIMDDGNYVDTILKITMTIDEEFKEVYNYKLIVFFTNNHYTVDNIKKYYQIPL